jgi:hypothetical protein
MKKTLLILLYLLFTLGSKVFAQSYGNEWINYSQKYTKISISEEGLYKITYDDVFNKKFSLGNLDPLKFQIFNKGKEVPLFITGTEDGVFNQGDIIYFYGNKNDASLDKVLYANQNDVPNEEISLFSDDNFYFLTYQATQNSLRYSLSQQSNSGLTPETFIITKSRLNFSDAYYPGEYILEAMSLSEYTSGEGYLGTTFYKGQTVNFNLNTAEYLNTAAYQPKLSFYVAGRSNASSTNSSGKNHHFRIGYSGTTLFDSLYNGYAILRKSIPININATSSNLSISSIDDLGALTDYQAMGYLEISYSRSLNISGLKSLNFSLNEAKNSSLISFSNSTLTSPIIIEKETSILFQPTGNQFVLSNTNSLKRYFLTDLSSAKGIMLNDVNFKNIGISTSKELLIISQLALKDGAEAYQQYHQSNGQATSLVYSDDLYNEFYFGFHHPMALRNYCSFMLDKGTIKPTYLLLLGKGYETPKGNLTEDLLPSMGYPPSDNMITSGLNGTTLEPALATGRIPAKTNTEVINYLDKLKVYNKIPFALRRKNILQVTGGKTTYEVNSFGSYQNSFYNASKNDFFGTYRTQIFKDVATPITENQTERIIAETKNGIGLLSYFGHGAATGTEISFGKTIDQKNPENPAIYLVNGCSTGECFTASNSLGENFILSKDVGAIGWIGTTSEGVASYLGAISLNFHTNWFNKYYGNSLAFGIKEGIKSSQNGSDKLNLAHIRQYILLGDPTLRFASPEKPDFNITNSYLSPSISNQNSTSSTLKLKLKIENIGKTTSDSLSIKIDRTLPNNTIISIPTYEIKPIYNLDSIEINLSNINYNVAGTNKVNVKIDSENKYNELSELNNQATLEIFLPGNGVNAIFPIKNGILNRNQVTLKAEPDDLFTKNAEYLFELDTISTFNSLFKKSSPIITAGILPEWNPGIILETNKTYFWRVKLNLDVDKGGIWSNSSFTFIPEISDGFSQSNKAQLDKIELNNIDFNSQTGKFSFKNTYFETSIYTEGDDGLSHQNKRLRTNQSISFSNSAFTGFTLAAMSNLVPNKFLNYPSPFNSTNGPVLVNGYTGQFFWDINDPIQVDSLIRFINQIPKDYYVMGFNGVDAAINQLPDAAKIALQSFGLTKFNLINRGEPYMFWGKKGSSVGSALEFTADYASSIPPKSQTLQYFNVLPFPLSSGSIKTEIIGPAKEWNNVDIAFFKNNADNINYDVFGINQNGLEVALKSSISNSKFSIKDINAKDYPYIKLRANIKDDVEYSVPNLKNFIVDYQPLAELSFNTDQTNNFYSKSINEGDTLKWNIALTNIYNYTSDSIRGTYTLTRPDNSTQIKKIASLPGLKSKETSVYTISEKTTGYVGKNNIRIQLENDFKDLYSFNNTISQDFEIIKDIKHPVLSVLFDGKTIINDEIVSPKPLITINTLDENKYLLLNDTTHLDVYLKKESDLNYSRISYASGFLKFTPSITLTENKSKVEFTPNLLSDGKYSLKVRSKDASGNYNSNDYVINFEVVNESSISNFYPYPNPVINSMKFVFTLTGETIPDKIKITIYASSGKIVRTINKEELGNLRIGNNISQFTWDGTDEFGDRLANGVYFYKVAISDTNDFSKRKTAGDQYFKNNTGKIYLMK